MPTTAQLRTRLMGKLKELFQLDQPDLDFGFYRIMHAQAEQVERFIDNDLLQIVAEAFGQVDVARARELKAAYETAVREAREEYGAPEPEKTPKALRAKAALDAARDTASNESEIYDHLYRFFERYYDNGDFISRRYYARENSGKAAPFAVPYNGEEVKLHWANADQYYIKTAEYFTNFTFDLRKGVRASSVAATLFETDEQPRRVHFRVIEATEGEHGNVKASESTKRFFIIHAPKPVEVNEHGELVINFEYRPDPEKSGQENSWRDKRNNEAVTTILAALTTMAQGDAVLAEYLQLLQTPAPTESEKRRVLLAKYINQYTARNTMDYFIHKDLGAFLRRELDFYIKNEVMRLDDIESAEAPAVETYLAKIKVLRRIAGKLIDFLAQLEDFQRKLWLKKKFVVETNYCITLDRVPEELYPEIAANAAQRQEWVKLFAIDEIAESTVSPGYTVPLTAEFLKANDKLVLDTRYFDEAFKARLLAAIENLDEQCDGLLIHSDNFQALNLLQESYRSRLKHIYIDPPYNTSASEIVYKNGYKHSSWLTLIANRVGMAKNLLRSDGVKTVAIDDTEMTVLSLLLQQIYGEYAVDPIVVNHHPAGAGLEGTNISTTHEYAIFLIPVGQKLIFGPSKTNETGRIGFVRTGTADSNLRIGRPNSFYAVLVNPENSAVVGAEPPPRISESNYPRIPTSDGLIRIYPVSEDGTERVWRRSYESCLQEIQNGNIECKNNRTLYLLSDDSDKHKPIFSNWTDTRYNAGVNGTNVLTNILGNPLFSYPKSIFTVMDCVASSTIKEQTGLILDYFAGSGTTGHAVISINREDGGSRKYILVEMGDYFDTVLKPRITKVVYSETWRDGKPTARDTGISHCFKYLRLESYEDALNNLSFDEDTVRSQALAANAQLREDYMLHYLLDVETRGSQSLLNIDAFADPTAYTLEVKQPGTDEYVTWTVDLIETFNYLIGLRVTHIAAPQAFTASFTRKPDPGLPKDQHTRLVVGGRIHQDTAGAWWFRKVEGWVPRDPANPNSGQREKVLIVWRKLTGDLEQDNLMLDEWFQKNRISTRDFEFDTIYVNGSNNLPNLLQEGDTWKVRLIEETFMQRMWDVEGG